MTRLIIIFVYGMVLFAAAAFGISGIADSGNTYLGSLSFIPVLLSFVLALTFRRWNRTRFGFASFALISTCSYIVGMFIVNKAGWSGNVYAMLTMLTVCALIPFLIQHFAFRGFSGVELRGYEVVEKSSMSTCCLVDGQRVWVSSPRHLPLKYDDIRIEGLINSIHSKDNPLLVIVLGVSGDSVDDAHYMRGKSSRKSWVEFGDVDSCRWWIKDNPEILSR